MAVRKPRAPGAPGQHFLRSSALATALVRDAGIEPGDLVVDLGAGAGVIAQAIAETGARAIAVELDPLLAARLHERFSGRSAVQVVEADARVWRLPEEPFAVLANLPFSGSREVLRRLLGDPRLPLRRADVILQWEAASKAASVWPGTLTGACWGAWYELAVTRRLGRSAFAPPPAVDAGVLRATRRPHPLVPADEHARYTRFVCDAYGRRSRVRSALGHRLSPRELKRLAPALGFSIEALPRDLDATQWAELFRFARARGRV